MPPQLTEAWSIAYLQILVVLLIFALSIPSIIFQLTLPEEIRRIINRHMKRYFLVPFISVMAVILIFSLSFIWFLHPCTGDIPPLKHWAGSIIISLSLIFFMILWWRYLQKLSKEKIVAYLEKKLWKKFEKNGRLNDEMMMDMLTLGERSEAGHEKEIVLETMSRLINKTQDSARYSGSELEDMLRNVNKIVAGKDKPGNEKNFLTFVRILEGIAEKNSGRKNLRSSDELVVYWDLKELGKKSVELKFSQVVKQIVGISPPIPDVLFEIGESAFNSGDYFSALAALSKLETMALNTAKKEQENTKNEEEDARKKHQNVQYQLFGLMAHFWGKGGSARRRVESFLQAYGNEFPDIDQILGQAVEAHYNDARYDTADKLVTMREEIAKSKKKKKVKNSQKFTSIKK